MTMDRYDSPRQFLYGQQPPCLDKAVAVRRFRCALLCWLGLGLAGCADKPNETAELSIGGKLVGTWEVTKSGSYAPAGAIFEFSKEGKLRVTFTKANALTEMKDAPNTTERTYTVAGDTINSVGPKGEKETLTIKKLTDTELVTEGDTAETGIVTGFHYTSDVPFKSVYLARSLRGGQSKFELVVGEQTFPLEARKRFFFTDHFPDGVRAFTIRGINESERVAFEPGDLLTRTGGRPMTERPFGHHALGSFPTGVTFVKEGAKPEVKRLPILKQYPTEYKRK